jgi:hypothetical protein
MRLLKWAWVLVVSRSKAHKGCFDFSLLFPVFTKMPLPLLFFFGFFSPFSSSSSRLLLSSDFSHFRSPSLHFFIFSLDSLFSSFASYSFLLLPAAISFLSFDSCCAAPRQGARGESTAGAATAWSSGLTAERGAGASGGARRV